MMNKRLILPTVIAFGLPQLSAAALPPTALSRLPTPSVQVSAKHPLRFPNAFGSHPQYPLEWWYITGHLQSQSGHPLGFQITFFRLRPPQVWDNPSAFNPRQIYFAQAAISDPRIGHLLTAQRIARAGMGLAGAKKDVTEVWIDHWSLRQKGAEYQARIDAQSIAYDLHFQTTQPPLLEGPDGVSQKGPDPADASYYYSIPQLRVTGSVHIDGKVQQVQGKAWLDHEWSAAYLPKQAVGWDWMGINLANGGALMLFQMRKADGRALWLEGTWRHADGRVQYLHGQQITLQPLRFWQSPETGNRYPVAWRVQIPGLQFTLQPLMNNQEFVATRSTGGVYWEGAVRAIGAGARPLGSGYLELTGYGGRLQMGLGQSAPAKHRSADQTTDIRK
ncbi:carotenoid 1,2-hydratase [Acidithiobacillus sp. CV18-2]|uniref:Carotenoid 1,2-hydratase n=1 Tax=Igneacidithiobacillus copahuensis TaxID=2724909 RepID=A0AAE3CIY9_9PROT|nr:lipocalin-like domain-containing protein [Igneacidithiobacillus copahuensis]MBU2754300.1 carotenoid 1,2-hydratase [Acidithiobacillus sp. CV18-3]MBU2757677.1 carotenoid 1,2-hydratase [Acidithiobacillus sp. BN09-2]MBU2777008.1 carotenoid 1,2-hydratase [Acidithiobacillus sp. CV18-2]MBU2797312.1 carotenoid 1,2-hydratase [Acidithiobacillus sp. VAN18-2]MBU2799841.1 carotenoid 1,2-hydratase [Acidithiobacillus sp. VAN18-4]UTV82006.1 carotenoid 1,2-hydratase [Acidithiobacillus sp. YTS05]